MYPLNILNFHGMLHAVLLAFVCWHRHARRDSAILAYVINFTWPRSLQPLPRVMRGSRTAEPSVWCQLQSMQLCSMQGQRSFVLRKSTQEWCSVTFSDKAAERRQYTEK